jgi:hypothetical protein
MSWSEVDDFVDHNKGRFTARWLAGNPELADHETPV